MKNSKDLDLTPALIDRLSLSEERINGMANGLLKIIPLEDPVGNITDSWKTDEGLHIKKIRSPFGVIGVVYEARPNVTSDVSGLCLKSGNAVILRGGKDSFNTSNTLVKIIAKTFEENGLPKHFIQMIPFVDREGVDSLIQMKDYVDLIIPRGGKNLIEKIIRL